MKKHSNQTVFYPQLNDFCRKYFITGVQLTPMDHKLLPQRFSDIQKSLFEQFLLFDSVSFKVWGENIPLAFLIGSFGKKGVEALVEQEAIKFVHWNQNVLHLVDDQEGINPLLHGKLTGEAHASPERSIELGLNFRQEKFGKKEISSLINKIAPLYTTPSDGIAKTAVKSTESAFLSGKLVGLGLDPNKIKLTSVPRPLRALMNKCADEVMEYSLLCEQKFTSYSKFEYFHLFNESAKKIADASKTIEGFNQIAQTQDVPDFKNIFDSVESPFAKVPKIRNKRSSKKFREWLAGVVSGESGHSVTREYTEAVTEGKGFFQKNAGKMTKTIAMTAIGTGIAAFLDARLETAVIASVAASKVLDPLADMGLDLLDAYVLDGLTKGWTPKLFFDDLERWVVESQKGKPAADQ